MMTSDVDKQQQTGSRSRPRGARAAGSLEGELRRFEPVPDAFVLAAIERAERHRAREREGLVLSDIAHHLGFVHGSWTTRGLRPQLEALVAAGAMSRARRHGVLVWSLTRAGHRQLARTRRAGKLGELPEAPQHRLWRQARAAADERIEGFREQVRRALGEASGLLGRPDASSDVWFAVAERLRSACRQLGSAVYCLREWQEPDDVSADVDDRCEPGDERLDAGERSHVRSLRAGRRNTWKWPDADAEG